MIAIPGVSNEVSLVLLCIEMRELLVGLGDAAELVDEVHVPGPAAELAVGGRLEADALLRRDGLDDRGVLGLAQLLAADRARGELLAGVQQGRRAQQAPDVIGAERRLCSLAHDRHAAPLAQ